MKIPIFGKSSMNAMKKLITIFAIIAIGMSCQKFDDSLLWNKLNEQTSALNTQEAKIKNLEIELARFNTDLASIKATIENISNGIIIKTVVPFNLNGITGWTTTFSDGSSATVYDGKDGAAGTDGKNGRVPVVSFSSVDGVLYWTIDGKLLKDDKGNNIPVKGAKGEPGANGQDAELSPEDGQPGTPGKSPVLRILKGNWEWSTDGTNWTVLGPATGIQGQTGQQGSAGQNGQGSVSFFKSVTKSVDGTKMTFEMKDGTKYTVNVGKPSSYTIAPDGKSMLVTVKDVSFKMILVEKGTFMMGGNHMHTPGAGGDTSDDHIHPVTFTYNFWIAETEATCGLYRTVMPDFNKEIGAYQADFPEYATDTHPFVLLYTECEAFTNALSEETGLPFRMPWEAEWEYAARGGKYSKGYNYAGSNNEAEVAVFYPWTEAHLKNVGETSAARAKREKVKTLKANELGLYDMSGNVDEFCNDSYTQMAYESNFEIRDYWIYGGTDPKMIKYDKDGNPKLGRVIKGGQYSKNYNSIMPYCRYVTDRQPAPVYKTACHSGCRLVIEINN